jgi:hypothetical protein
LGLPDSGANLVPASQLLHLASAGLVISSSALRPPFHAVLLLSTGSSHMAGSSSNLKFKENYKINVQLKTADASTYLG